MGNFVTWPVQDRKVVRRDRSNLLFSGTRLNPDRTPIDMTGSVWVGEVRKTKGESGAALAVVDFSGNDLANGVIEAVITEVEAVKVVDGLAAANLEEGICELIETDVLGVKRTRFEYTIIPAKVAIP